MTITITTNTRAVSAWLQAIVTRQLPFALTQTVNSLAFKVREDAHAEMRSVFDRPTPNFTLRSIVVDRASKARPRAWVGLRHDGGFRKALAHEMRGGSREWKKMEGALLKLGMIPAGMNVVPGESAPLNAYGNLTASYVRSLLTRLKTGKAQGKKAYGGAQVGFFAVGKGHPSKLHPGIWERVRFSRGYAVRPILMFVRSARYRPLINLHRIGTEALKRDGHRLFRESLGRAVLNDRSLMRAMAS